MEAVHCLARERHAAGQARAGRHSRATPSNVREGVHARAATGPSRRQGRTREPWRRPGDRQVRRGGASCAPFHSMFTLDLLLVLASSRVGLERRPRETIGEPLATRPDAASRVRRVRVCSYQPRSSKRRAGLPLSGPSPRRRRAWGRAASRSRPVSSREPSAARACTRRSPAASGTGRAPPGAARACGHAWRGRSRKSPCR